MNATAKRHMGAIARDSIRKTNVIGLKKILNAQWRKDRGYSVSMVAPKVCREEVQQLRDAIAERMPRVRGELDESGRKLLRSPRYRKRLASVADIIADLRCFRLVGFEEINSGNHVPIFRAYDSRGRHFTFRNIPWQSVAYSREDLESGPVVIASDMKGDS